MGYAVTVRMPVTRTYPSEIAIPGNLYVHVGAYSNTRLKKGQQVTIFSQNGVSAVPAEVLSCDITGRLPSEYNYTTEAG